MPSRWRAALAAAFLVAGLLTPAVVVASDGSPPSCSDASISTNEDNSVDSSVSCSDSDPFTYSVDSDPAHGSVSLDPDSGAYTYTPDADYFGPDSFTFIGTDPVDGPSLTPATLDIMVNSVNDPPSFTKGPDDSTPENSGSQTVSNWATGISKGPPNESSQTLTFVITGDTDTSLFSVLPAVSSNGTLTYTPATNASGTATITLHLEDDGGTLNGGKDSSPNQSFDITITSVNQPPSFTVGPDQTDLEDAGPQSISNWATDISRGPPDESGQTLTFHVSNNNTALFSSQPSISSGGTLTYTSAANANGSATVTVYLQDNGGTANGGHDTSATQTFTITITPVNDAPSFTKGSSQTVLEDAGAQTVIGWASAISPGPPDETSQTVTFHVSNNNTALFASQPSISSGGTLTYTPAANGNGSPTVTVYLQDNGGTANGGHDASTPTTFKITITPVNDPPTCASDSNATFVNSALNASITSCADVDGDPLTYAMVTGPAHGTLALNSNGTYTYTPNASFQGTDSFTFKANDGTVDSTTNGTMSILVSPDPIARNDVAPTDFPPIIQGSGPTAIPVLANDLDKQGGPLLIQSVTQGAKGKVVMTGGGTGLTYDPTGLVTGTDSFRYTIVDNQSRTNSAIVVVIISPDTIRPVTTAPVISITGGTLGTSTAKVRISWTASDVGTGVKSIQLQESVDGGTFHTVALPSLRTTSLVRSVLVFHTYRYRVRATDVVGNVGIYAAGAPFRMSRYQESYTAVSFSGTWASAVSTAYSGGRSRWSTGAGTSATFVFSGGAVAWVSAKGPSRGSAQVFVDGVLIRTISLYRSTNLYRQVVFSARFSSVGPHTLTIVNPRTTGHPRVDADAFLVIR